MNSIFYPISHIKKPISLKFLVYIKSANHSKAFDMVSMVAQKAMTQFYVWQIRYEIAQCACVYVVVCADGCVHTDEKFSSEQTQSCLLLNFLGFSYTHEHTHSSLQVQKFLQFFIPFFVFIHFVSFVWCIGQHMFGFYVILSYKVELR